MRISGLFRRGKRQDSEQVSEPDTRSPVQISRDLQQAGAEGSVKRVKETLKLEPGLAAVERARRTADQRGEASTARLLREEESRLKSEAAREIQEARASAEHARAMKAAKAKTDAEISKREAQQAMNSMSSDSPTSEASAELDIELPDLRKLKR